MVISLFGFANIFQFLPQDFNSLIYVPNLSELYDAAKKTNSVDIFVNQIGFEQMIFGVLEQQLMVKNYTLDDVDLFNELLIAATVDGSAVIAIGPSKNPEKIKEIFETFSGQPFPSDIMVKDGYFIFSNLPFGGKLPEKVKQNIDKGYLAVSYMNLNDDIKMEGFGYVKLEGNTLVFHNEEIPMDKKTKDFVLDVSEQKGKDILADKNIGGDLFLFMNRKIPDTLMSIFTNISDEFLRELSELLDNFSGTFYLSANISDVILNSLSGMEQSSIPFYGVVYYKDLTWEDLEISKFENVNGEKYGVEYTEEGTPVLYVKLSDDKAVFYGVRPDQYVPGDRCFIEQNYSDEYIFGLFLNLSPTIFNFIGIDTEAYLKGYTYIKDEKIVFEGMLK
ncbi:hypothetical protein BW47_04920 [Thermosipho melanesiensis]|uniref:Uncharacterized protein n=1 Tax=Thermosipho melanesiensis TaxID=46541 RepID=A0ABN4UXK7_9BACT|nr:hypothetical protein BW47_04920 [Thermosipho melanesiensis]